MDKNKEIFYKTLLTYVKEKYGDDDTISFLLDKIETVEPSKETIIEPIIEPEEGLESLLVNGSVDPALASRIIWLDKCLKESVNIIKRMDEKKDNKYKTSNIDFLNICKPINDISKTTNFDFLDVTRPINPYNKGFHNIVDNLKIDPLTDLEVTEFIEKYSTIHDETVKPLNKATEILKRVNEEYGSKVVNEDVINNVEMTNSQIDLELTKDNIETLSGPWVNSNLLSDVNVVNEEEIKSAVEEVNSNK